MGYTAANRRTIKLMVEQAAPLFEDGSAPMFMNMATAVIEVAVGKLFYAIAPAGAAYAGEKRLYLRTAVAPFYEDQGNAAAPATRARVDEAAAANAQAVASLTDRQAQVEDAVQGALSSSSYRPTPADGADLPIDTYFLAPNAGDAGAVWVYQRVAGAPGYTAIQRQEFSADQIADGETNVSMTKGERAKLNTYDIDLTNPDALLAIVDAARRVAMLIELDTTMRARIGIGAVANGLKAVRQADGLFGLQLGDVEGRLPVGSGALDTTYFNPDVLTYILTKDSRVLAEVGPNGLVLGSSGSSEEVVTARGSAANLNARLSALLTPSGLGNGPVYVGRPFRSIPQLLSRLAAGAAGTVLSFVLVGDSWTDNNYYVPLLCAAMSAKYGNAGDGYCPVERGSALGGATLTRSGTWTVVNTATGGGPTPGAALISATSSTAGSYVRYACTTQHTSAFLHSVGNGAVVEVSLDDGATWGAPITLTGAALRVDQIAAVAFSALRVRLVSGTWTVCGIEGRKDGPGIRWHNLGAGSGTMARALSCPETDYITSLAALTPHAISMGWGVNEALGGASTTAFIANQNTMLARFDAAAPLSDRVVWSPPEVLGGAPVMRDYGAATRENSAGKFTHLNLQPLFGNLTADYGNTGMQLLGTQGGGGGDGNHPTLWGSHAIKSALQSVLEGNSL
ncbi:MAG: hypothetical protein DI540_00995 [Sphingobium sp.]|nr:MAG: hypothetical protein DI540_00995 [Sphingobium sp.]